MVYPTEEIDGEDYYYDENDNNALKSYWIPAEPKKDVDISDILAILNLVFALVVFIVKKLSVK